jgi:hypothetical protein
VMGQSSPSQRFTVDGDPPSSGPVRLPMRRSESDGADAWLEPNAHGPTLRSFATLRPEYDHRRWTWEDVNSVPHPSLGRRRARCEERRTRPAVRSASQDRHGACARGGERVRVPDRPRRDSLPQRRGAEVEAHKPRPRAHRARRHSAAHRRRRRACPRLRLDDRCKREGRAADRARHHQRSAPARGPRACARSSARWQASCSSSSTARRQTRAMKSTVSA